jgi:hypothetical protein
VRYFTSEQDATRLERTLIADHSHLGTLYNRKIGRRFGRVVRHNLRPPNEISFEQFIAGHSLNKSEMRRARALYNPRITIFSALEDQQQTKI